MSIRLRVIYERKEMGNYYMINIVICYVNEYIFFLMN